jgi:histidine ammonia-lyase
VLDWADAIAAMTFENLGTQAGSFDADTLRLRVSPALRRSASGLRVASRQRLLAQRAGRHTQDPLSLRAIPRCTARRAMYSRMRARSMDRELASVTDNPVVIGTLDAPRALSEARMRWARPSESPRTRSASPWLKLRRCRNGASIGW